MCVLSPCVVLFLMISTPHVFEEKGDISLIFSHFLTYFAYLLCEQSKSANSAYCKNVGVQIIRQLCFVD